MNSWVSWMLWPVKITVDMTALFCGLWVTETKTSFTALMARRYISIQFVSCSAIHLAVLSTANRRSFSPRHAEEMGKNLSRQIGLAQHLHPRRVYHFRTEPSPLIKEVILEHISSRHTQQSMGFIHTEMKKGEATLFNVLSKFSVSALRTMILTPCWLRLTGDFPRCKDAFSVEKE